MKITNEVYLSGTATEVKQWGNGPSRFQVKQRGLKKRDGSGYWPDEYFNVIAWPKQIQADVIEKIKPDISVEVCGRLKPCQWEKDGVKHRSFDVVAEQITFPEPEPLTPSLDRTLITDADIPF